MKGDRQREGVAMAFIRRVARVGSEWGGLVRKGLGLSRVHSGSKERSVRCVRREKHIPGSEGRELLEQEEDTGVYRSVSGTGTWVRGWSEGLQVSIWQLHLIPEAIRSHSSYGLQR